MNDLTLTFIGMAGGLVMPTLLGVWYLYRFHIVRAGKSSGGK